MSESSVTPPDQMSLHITLQQQQASNWCWAACVSMCSSYYFNPWVGQCAVASDTLKNKCCTPIPGPCNVPLPLTSITNSFHLENMNAQYSGPITAAKLLSEIGIEHRPVVLGFTGLHIGHVVLAIGYYAASSPYTPSNPLVTICDPDSDTKGGVQYQYIDSLFPDATWTASIVNISKKST